MYCGRIASRFALLAACLFWAYSAVAAPYSGDVFTYHQPDGSTFKIKLYGDEFYAVAETLDGYTITQDADTRFFCYAKLSADGTALISTGVRIGAAPEGLAKHVRISKFARKAIADAARKRFGVDGRGRPLPLLAAEEGEAEGASVVAPAPPSTTTVGKRVGLVLLASFPDRQSDITITRAEVDAFCNDPNYTGYGNATSIYGYFYIQSNGKLKYNNVVTAYFTAANNRSYYTDSSISYGVRARELINEGIGVLRTQGFDFSSVDGDGNGILDGINCYYAGTRVNSWSQGLWPHKSSTSFSNLSGSGLSTSSQYQITDMTSQLTMGTFTHENGHMICRLPDLYSYDGNAANISYYSLMASGSYAGGGKHPVSIDSYLKMHAGWTNIIDINSADHFRCAVDVDKNTFYRYQASATEYFLIGIRTNAGYEGPYGGHSSSVNPGNGLVIFHCKENGSNTHSSIFTSDSPTDYSTPYELLLVEASPTASYTPWYRDPSPGSSDAFHSGGVSALSDATTPSLRFWASDGRTVNSGLQIHSISAQGEMMTFIVGAGAVTGSPEIAMTVAGITTECEFGSDAASKDFGIYNKGGGTLNYSVSENASWASLTVTSGTATSECDRVTVNFDTDSLAAGTYNATITVTDGGASNSPQTIPITLTVNPQPTINVSPATVTVKLLADTTGSSIFTLTNTGGGTLFYTVSESASWLSLGTTSGTASGEADEIDLSFDATGYTSGTETTNVTISSTSATNSPATVTVNMVVQDIQVTTPNGGETFIRGKIGHRIAWVSSANVPGNVKIELHRGGSLHSTIAASAPNSGEYLWDVPGALALGTDYSVVITSVDNAAMTDESDANFTVTTATAFPYSESFESDFGEWAQSGDDNMDWTRRSGSTPSSSTGPSAAHDGSYYIYTEASGSTNQTARLSLWLDLRTATIPVATFAYHMYGAAMGTLQMRASLDGNTWTSLFSLSGDQGDSWQTSTFDLSAYAGRIVAVEIHGLTGSNYTSDIAIDLVSFHESTKYLSYSPTTMSETVNDGSISTTVTITATNETFTSDVVSGGHVTASNVPGGLAASFTRVSDTVVTLDLTGNATNHGDANDISDLTVTFADAAFTGGSSSTVARSTQLLSVDFIESGGLSIDDVTVTEGDLSNVDATFTVTLTPASGSTVTVNYATSDVGATAGSDYTAVSGTLTFAAGETSKTVTVPVLPDTIHEGTETFTVDLSGASGASIADSQGIGTIIDNESSPTISIDDVSVTEGDSGTVNAVFTVTLSHASASTVTVDYASSDDTATAGTDYTAVSSTLSFTAGVTSNTITVVVNGDTDSEGNETFNIILSSPTYATIADGTGVGTIGGDDGGVPSGSSGGGGGGGGCQLNPLDSTCIFLAAVCLVVLAFKARVRES